MVLDNDTALREQLAILLSRLGKNDFSGVSDFIFAPSDKRLSNAWLYPALAALPLVSLGWAMANFQHGLIALVAAAGLNMFIYYRNKAQLEKELDAVSYITAIVVTATRIRKATVQVLPDLSRAIDPLLKPLKSVTGFGSGVLMRPLSPAQMPPASLRTLRP